MADPCTLPGGAPGALVASTRAGSTDRPTFPPCRPRHRILVLGHREAASQGALGTTHVPKRACAHLCFSGSRRCVILNSVSSRVFTLPPGTGPPVIPARPTLSAPLKMATPPQRPPSFSLPSSYQPVRNPGLWPHCCVRATQTGTFMFFSGVGLQRLEKRLVHRSPQKKIH